MMLQFIESINSGDRNKQSIFLTFFQSGPVDCEQTALNYAKPYH